MMQKNYGDQITLDNQRWSFATKGVATNFSQHIRKSLPFYEQGHEMVCQLSDFL